MAKLLMCDQPGCERPASVHLTEIRNGQSVEKHLCAQCAADMGLTSEKQILDLEKLFGLLEDRRPEESEPPRVCDQCGMSYQSFRRGGRLGCSHDYQEFAELLVPLLRRVHGNERHVGKTPKRIGRDLARRRYISQLRSDMKAAVAREDYEQAARLRDEIKEIETEEASHEAR